MSGGFSKSIIWTQRYTNSQSSIVKMLQFITKFRKERERLGGRERKREGERGKERGREREVGLEREKERERWG